MQVTKRTAVGFGSLALALAALLIVGLAFPAMAAPPAQEDILPTPTLFPVDQIPYTLEEVGGSPDPVVFPAQEIDGVRFTETAVVSNYPAGMTFSVGVELDPDEIKSVSWTMIRDEKFTARAPAEYDADSGLWVAHPWEDGGEPVGREGNFRWRLLTADGTQIETEPAFVAYWDPEHVWWRMESDLVIFYWSGFGEDNPHAIARGMANFLAGVYPRWVAGFGRGLSYKPQALVYPDHGSYAGRFLSGIVNESQGGVTEFGDGLTTQRLREAPAPGLYAGTCIWSPRIPSEFYTFDVRVHELYTTVAHEFTHLYQGDVLGGTRGPTWWSEGQAEWFSNGTPHYADERLHHLSRLQHMPTLQKEVGYQTTEADGCFRLAYDAGASFVNWLLANYGGIDTHLKIVELQYNNVPLFDAIEQVTGKPFIEIENEWRAYHGFAALDVADVNPAAALQPYDDPVLAVGDTVVLPADLAVALIYQEPKPNALASGSCWANMEVKILDIGQINDTVYVQVDCMGQIGWMPRDQVVGEE